MPKEDLQKLRHYAARCGIELEGGTKINLSSCRCAVDHLLQYLEVALFLDMKLVRVAFDGGSIDELYSVLQQCAPVYEKARVKLAVENHFYCTSNDLVRLVKSMSSETVGICLDTANSIAAGEWPEKTIRKLLPFAFTVHLKDFIRSPHPDGTGVVITGAPLGKGVLNVQYVAQELAHAQELRSIVIELWLPRGGTEKELLAKEEEWVEQSLAVAKLYFETY
ncbi:MAG: TIM barrel protein [Candidatus Bathyarchaeia archaeon]